MTDPLAELVALLQPTLAYSKKVSGADPWRVSRSDLGQPFYCAVLEGSCRLAIAGQPVMVLEADDFVLVPAAHHFVISSLDVTALSVGDTPPIQQPTGEFCLGDEDAPVTVQMVIGHCTFASSDSALLVSLLPHVIHVRGQGRLATLVQLVREEFAAVRPVRDIVLARLLEVIFIEALRSTVLASQAPGLLRGLGDERIATALRIIHADPMRAWSVDDLARQAALSRSGFFAKFQLAMGVPPMAYVLTWRMALAKQLLRQQGISVADVAQQTGYGSASAFTVAFTRHTGCSPARYARQLGALL